MWNAYDIRLAQLTDEENRKFHPPPAMASAKNWWWYRRGFAQGLLWLDEGDTDKRFREMQFIEDIERDIRDICVQDGRWKNAIIPLSFDVGLQHALKPTKTPEDDDITAPIDISDEDMTVAPMETRDRVMPMHPRRQDVRDPIRYIQVGKGLLAARPRPSLRDLESWKSDLLITLFHSYENGNRIRTIQDRVRHCIGMQNLHLHMQCLSSKPSRTLSEVDKASVLKVDLVLKRLRKGDKVVVHCHAGYHRTGFFIYVLLRRYGLTAHQSLEALRTTRPCIHYQMTYSKKNRPSLADKAETVFNTLFP